MPGKQSIYIYLKKDIQICFKLGYVLFIYKIIIFFNYIFLPNDGKKINLYFATLDPYDVSCHLLPDVVEMNEDICDKSGSGSWGKSNLHMKRQ